MDEQQVIAQLSQYRQKRARMQVLSTYSIGAGMTVSRWNEDDQLQDLHRRLRGMPSYMYLNGYEQKLENVAHAYLTRYPAGTRSQKRAIPAQSIDPEEEKMLQQLREKIQKVIEARGGHRDDMDEVIERLAEYQDLKAELERIDTVLQALENYKPEYARLLKVHYIAEKSWIESAQELKVSKDGFYRLRKKAIKEYEKLAN